MENDKEEKEHPPRAAVRTSLHSMDGIHLRERTDELAAEEPMEVRVVVQDGRPVRHSIAVTMRTPGNDFELAAGFLFSEGIVPDGEAIQDIQYCGTIAGSAQYNVVNVQLKPGTPFDPRKFSRNVYTTSSCGICGKASLEMVRAISPGFPVGSFRLEKDFFLGLPEKLGKAQALFSRTGGLHASALFDAGGKLILMREDVGRHNAMDKLVGARLLEGALPLSDTVVLVSGRASYELIQKALMAGIPTFVALGAPSSLAVDMAREFRMTLIGFLRDGRFNVYAGKERIRGNSRRESSSVPST